MAFITEDFLLQSNAAKRLYHTYAAGQPILDYHCHLSPRDIAENRRFRNLFEIWLEGDHYKWRAMRANGVAERFCTGDADPYEKFLAWAQTVPRTLRNPLYHWTHLELEHYFGIDQLLNETSAERIWQQANEHLMDDDLTAQGILKKFGVVALCTTDDPTDSLEHHKGIANSGISTKVFPTFRPDRAFRTEDPYAFNEWTDRLSAAAGLDISKFSDFVDAVAQRHEYFHRHGCRLSDHGLDRCYSDSCSDREASGYFDRVRSGKNLSPPESAKFAGHLMMLFGRFDFEKGWTKQLHLGAFRNTNTRMRLAIGGDTGFDSIGDRPQTGSLIAYLDRLDREKILPRVIVFNVNPTDNYAMATAIGNFQDSSIPGKMQFGPAWWFLDQKEGIELQLNALSNCGLLSRFVGMVTDSRSFMSYPRHEYFRRVLCNLLGGEIEAGLLPNDENLIGTMVTNICFDNAAAYSQLPSVQRPGAAPALLAHPD
jgi:glucuronate isomerase